MGDLYRLDFKSGKSYVGITRRTARERYVEHQQAAAKSQKGVVYKAWNKYGAPDLVILDSIGHISDLYQAEIDAIVKHGTRHPHGYNLTDGGDIPPSLSPEVAAKISARLKGRKLSPEHIAKVTSAVKGRPVSMEARAKSSAKQKGRTFTEETRTKMSVAAKARSVSEVTKVSMSEAQKRRRRAEGFLPQKPRKPALRRAQP
ncbi:grpIintron_endo, group I intron endonuclease [uncultured Caudovirales phage]|uniref:GrpIintron_endo, group I intron endonuclease n=1 Tax=uncultured Caudovirales phage TaxID=2100421 RepID=A0A6J7WVY0_9CAUD|nr:grpIintron_endo, group I intron endonuclease [uncultured Caudovirales phage]